MAGLDGIENKIHPGGPMDKDLYALPPEELAKVPQVCGSLREALDSLKADHGFLLKGGVFDKDFIEAYIDLKYEDVYAFEHPLTQGSSRCTTPSDFRIGLDQGAAPSRSARPPAADPLACSEAGPRTPSSPGQIRFPARHGRHAVRPGP